MNTVCSQPSTSGKSLLQASLLSQWRRLRLRLHQHQWKQWNATDSLLDSVSAWREALNVSLEEAKRAVSDGLELPLALREARPLTHHVHAKVLMANPPVSMAQLVLEYNDGLNEALLTSDERKIRDFYIKWNGDDLHPDKFIFWTAIHKTITGRKSLPITFRMRSKQWLAQRNLESLDDGELDAYLKNPVDGDDIPF